MKLRDADYCRVFTAETEIKLSFYCQLDTTELAPKNIPASYILFNTNEI